MATRLYFAADDTAVYDPPTRKGAWDKTSGAATFRLAATRTGQGTQITNTENVATVDYDVLVATWISDPLRDNVTIDGTLDLIIGAAESNADADDVLHLHVWVTQGDSDTVRGTLLTDYIDSTEFAVSATVTAFTSVTMPQQSLSSVAAQAGDRIVVEVGYRAANSIATSRNAGFAVGGRSASDLVGGESAYSATVNAAGWIEFSENLSFDATYLYTANDTIPATPSGVVGTWDAGSPTDKLLGRTKAGSGSNNSAAESVATNPWDVIATRYVSDQLAAQTIPAVAVHFMLRLLEAAADADAFTKIHLYVMKPDGTVRGTLISNLVDGTELSTSVIRRQTSTLSSVVASSGDRLVLEVGARFTNVLTSARSVVSYWGQTGNDIGSSTAGGSDSPSSTQHSGWFRIAKRLTWADEVTATSRSFAVIAA